MNWIYLKDRLPSLGVDQLIPDWGSVKRSNKLMVATLNGAIYAAYYEVYRSADGDLTTKWSLVYESDYCDIDSDGIEIFNVYAWADMPELPKLKV